MVSVAQKKNHASNQLGFNKRTLNIKWVQMGEGVFNYLVRRGHVQLSRRHKNKEYF